MTINLIKLCVGVDSAQQMIDFVTMRASQNLADYGEAFTVHVTRMYPKREAELLDGGSLYWVIKGRIALRQPILRLERDTGEDGISRCVIVLSPSIIRTQAAPRRAFQGWRYLSVSDAPPDVAEGGAQAGDPQIAEDLADLGLL